MSEALKQVDNPNYSDLPYHNKETEAIQAERAEKAREVPEASEEHAAEV